MVTAEEIEARSALIEEGADLAALRDRLSAAAEPLLARMPPVPRVKALLSRDGGVCVGDGAPLRFDPWSPDVHRCSRCGREHRGDRHHRHWARFQHLWLAERAGHLAALAALGGNGPAAERAAGILRAYEGYPEFPNSDNVLGPARLFFSTYLESIWTTNYLTAAHLLREAGMLDDATAEVVNTVADGTAALIGEFDEGFSNRQTWHNAALAAVAVWFEDAELAERALESDTGLLAHLAHGFAADGTWHEGENYHLFALQGLLTGIRWARGAGVDPLADAALAGRLADALRAPTLTALPDRTFPARKDSRFGVSLAQPMYLDLWERGLGMLAGREGADLTGLDGWLRALYAGEAPAAQLFDSCLHEAGRDAPQRRTRADLPWTSLLEMNPALAEEHGLRPESVLFASQGLAVLRTGARYASLECGQWTGGHGHPDRLHFTLHAGGVYWLPDPGTGSYVERDLFWYRSTLAHNAPRLDGASQSGGDAVCEAFDLAEGWGWVRGRWDGLSRTVVSGPDYLLDVVQLGADGEVLLELPWHLPAGIEVIDPGHWEPASLDDEFVHDVERFVPDSAAPIQLRGDVAGVPFAMTLAFEGDLLRAMGPGTPGSVAPAPFFLQRARGRGLVFAAAISTGEPVRQLAVQGSSVVVETAQGTDTHSALSDGWEIATGERRVKLTGLRPRPVEFEPLITRTRRLVERAMASFVPEPPALDGSLDGFDDSHPIALDHEDQYRRSEEPFAGPDEFSASAWLNWDADRLYLAASVAKPDVWFRPSDAPPLQLDNEADDIHSDGLQVYLSDEAGGWGVLVVPESGGSLRVRPIGDRARPSEVSGSWQPIDGGYRVTLALEPEWWTQASVSREVGFDLIVNEMRPGRERRAGQLVWSGGGGWVWLRGDRQDSGRFGRLDLT